MRNAILEITPLVLSMQCHDFWATNCNSLTTTCFTWTMRFGDIFFASAICQTHSNFLSSFHRVVWGGGGLFACCHQGTSDSEIDILARLWQKKSCEDIWFPFKKQLRTQHWRCVAKYLANHSGVSCYHDQVNLLPETNKGKRLKIYGWQKRKRPWTNPQNTINKNIP